VQASELLIVLGGNGCGKTTLLRCITRALVPTAGEVWLNGTEISGLTGERLRRARLDLAMISQHANLVRRRNVLANVALGTLGRHQTWWTALGGLPAEEPEAGALIGEVLRGEGIPVLTRARLRRVSHDGHCRAAIRSPRNRLMSSAVSPPWFLVALWSANPNSGHRIHPAHPSGRISRSLPACPAGAWCSSQTADPYRSRTLSKNAATAACARSESSDGFSPVIIL